MSLGRGFEATVELLLQSSEREGNKSVNEGDASVIIISGEDESPAQKRARRKSHEEQGAGMSGSGRRTHGELEGAAMSESEKRCLEELQGVVAAVSGVIGSTSSSSKGDGHGVLQRIARWVFNPDIVLVIIIRM